MRILQVAAWVRCSPSSFDSSPCLIIALPQGLSSHTQCRAEVEGRGQRQGQMLELELELEQRGLQVSWRGSPAEHYFQYVPVCSMPMTAERASLSAQGLSVK